MVKVTFEVADTLSVPVGDTNKTTVVDIAAIYKAFPDVCRFALINGFVGALNNVSRGKDEDTGKPNSNDVWASMREKRAAVWLRDGTWAGRGGGGAESKGLKEAWLADRLAAGSTIAKAEAAMKAMVISVFGSKPNDDKASAVPVTFDNFLRAVATTAARREDAKAAVDSDAANANYAKLLETWEGKAAALRAERSAATDAIDIGDMGL